MAKTTGKKSGSTLAQPETANDTQGKTAPKPQPKEQARIEAVAAKAQARVDAPAMELEMKGNVLEVTFKHPDPVTADILMMADLGTCDPCFMVGAHNQVAGIGAPGAKIDATNSNFILSVVRGVQPRDELEAMLAIQMGAIHLATMTMARRLNHVDNIPQQDSAERTLNKLARTYAMQMEALKRYRTGGQQKVTVEHVTVNQGGQAIVGTVDCNQRKKGD
jgi:hypothetical protein